MIDLNKEKLELDYPCSWKYKIVLLESIDAKGVVKSIVLERTHTLKDSNTSKKGKYKSYSIELIVHNEDDRKELYKLFGDHIDIKMVL
jgi:putative lipoic acid-binding regulatory protein